MCTYLDLATSRMRGSIPSSFISANRTTRLSISDATNIVGDFNCGCVVLVYVAVTWHRALSHKTPRHFRHRCSPVRSVSWPSVRETRFAQHWLVANEIARKRRMINKKRRSPLLRNNSAPPITVSVSTTLQLRNKREMNHHLQGPRVKHYVTIRRSAKFGVAGDPSKRITSVKGPKSVCVGIITVGWKVAFTGEKAEVRERLLAPESVICFTNASSGFYKAATLDSICKFLVATLQKH